MKVFDRETLLLELWNLTRTNVLRTDAECDECRGRVKEICSLFGERFPEDVFDRFVYHSG